MNTARLLEKSLSFRGFPALFAAAVLAVSGVATAQRPGGPPSPMQQALDTNHDGTLSADEVKAAPRSLLALDKNGDGRITPDELQSPETPGASPEELVTRLMAFDKNGDGILVPDELPARMQNLFERADTNHDGKLTPDEIRGLAQRQIMPTGPQAAGGNMMRGDMIFNALDTDHDGEISAAEIAAASTSLLSLDKNGDGQIAADEMRPRQASPEEMAQHFLDENDTDKDGKISRAEAPDFVKNQFDAIDKNGDGFLDKTEIQQYFSSMGRQRGGPGGPEGPRNGMGPGGRGQGRDGQPPMGPGEDR